MSTRVGVEPSAEEHPLCPGCGKPVQRNRYIIDNQTWHHGCAKSKGLKTRFYCRSCFRFFTYAAANWAILNGRKTLMCPNCGSMVLKRVSVGRRRRRLPF